jgi:halimadienyl-diphosphate synthase
MDIYQSVYELLKEIGEGKMSNTAYDTAWAARLGEIDKNISEKALKWICDHQLKDGSWGASTPINYHDRVICTLAAMTALTKRGRRAQDRTQIEKGQIALDRIAAGATKGLTANSAGATVGFEMIVPTLLAEAEALGIIQHQHNHILGRLAHQRTTKLSLLQGQIVNRFVTMAFSAEMAGPDGLKLLDVDNLQEDNGSVGNSPSATAYFIMNLRSDNEKAFSYLRNTITLDGGVPNVAPFDTFERAWVLWNLSLTKVVDDEILRLSQPHLDFLQNAWEPGKGIGPAANYTPKDSDDSSIAFEVLSRFNRPCDLEAILHYEQKNHFRCFQLEANPSISANIHVLGALRQAGLEANHPSVQKIARFLALSKMDATFWFDKWHISPYYSSAHAIITCAGYMDDLVESTIAWISQTQNADGSWGYYSSTAEETAYCIQALLIWKRHDGKVDDEVIAKGAHWLKAHTEPPYPPLWIGKCLYSPEFVVRSSILSALLLLMAEK